MRSDFKAFTLESEGLFDGERDPQQGELIFQHLFPSSLLLNQLVHLRRLLEGSVEPDGERIKLPIRLHAAFKKQAQRSVLVKGARLSKSK